MNKEVGKFCSVILAGERPVASALAHAFNVPASVLVPVAGKPTLLRVIEAIRDSQFTGGGVICGPAPEIVEKTRVLQELLQQPDFEWVKPAKGPAASALMVLEKLRDYPVLLATGDHALLTAEIVDEFCNRALLSSRTTGCDCVLGLVPYELVKSVWPGSKRTVLKFSDGEFCGSNLFAILNQNGLRALSFWQQAEADRKHPWRIAWRFSPVTLLSYLLRSLTAEGAMDAFSTATGCQIKFVQLDFARAAVDVDTVEDQQLADAVLSAQTTDSV